MMMGELILKSLRDHTEISFLLQHLSIIISTLIVGYAPKRKKNYWLKAGMVGGISLCILVLISSTVLAVNTSIFEVFWLGTQACYAVVILFLFNDYKITTRICTFFFHLTDLAVVMLIINQASRLGSHYGVSDGILWLLRSFFSLLLIPCAFAIRKWNVDKYTQIARSAVVLAGVISAITVSMFVYMWETDLKHEQVFYSVGVIKLILAFMLAMMGINLIYCYMVERSCVQQEQIQELLVSGRDWKRIEELLAVADENAERFHEIRHDIKNHFSYLNVMAKKGNVEGIQTYLKELSYDFLEPLKPINCGNRIMNTIVNMEVSKADRLGIPMDVQVIVPEELPFAEKDLCSLMVNVIDNALEGWVKRDPVESVIVRMIMQGDELVFCVDNPTDKRSDFTESMATTKKNQDIHGYGVKIVKKIVEKYQGYYEYKIEDGSFCFNCILNK